MVGAFDRAITAAVSRRKYNRITPRARRNAPPNPTPRPIPNFVCEELLLGCVGEDVGEAVEALVVVDEVDEAVAIVVVVGAALLFLLMMLKLWQTK